MIKRRVLTIVMIISMLGICIRFWVSQDTHINIKTQTQNNIVLSMNKISAKSITENIPSYNLNSEDKYLLAKIAMAEAEGQSLEGKAHVIMVVLNRIEDNKFPSTIRDVIFAPRQFSPISDGRWDRVEPSEECWEALDMVINGWDKSQGALYFESCPDPDNWHSRNLEYLFTHGGHRFYK